MKKLQKIKNFIFIPLALFIVIIAAFALKAGASQFSHQDGIPKLALQCSEPNIVK
jgi:hypothetical protein